MDKKAGSVPNVCPFYTLSVVLSATAEKLFLGQATLYHDIYLTLFNTKPILYIVPHIKLTSTRLLQKEILFALSPFGFRKQCHFSFFLDLFKYGQSKTLEYFVTALRYRRKEHILNTKAFLLAVSQKLDQSNSVVTRITCFWKYAPCLQHHQAQ